MRNLQIPKSKHRSRIAWSPFLRSGKIFSFHFDESARYNIGENQDALNKLIGFSDGTLNHHKNSFRFAWRYNIEKDVVEIHGYVYRDGQRETMHLFDAQIYELVKVKVECDKNVYRILREGYQIFYMKRSIKVWSFYKHMLWPYFGGTEVAPHNINILVNWLWK